MWISFIYDKSKFFLELTGEETLNDTITILDEYYGIGRELFFCYNDLLISTDNYFIPLSELQEIKGHEFLEIRIITNLEDINQYTVPQIKEQKYAINIGAGVEYIKDKPLNTCQSDKLHKKNDFYSSKKNDTNEVNKKAGEASKNLLQQPNNISQSSQSKKALKKETKNIESRPKTPNHVETKPQPQVKTISSSINLEKRTQQAIFSKKLSKSDATKSQTKSVSITVPKVNDSLIFGKPPKSKPNKTKNILIKKK